MKHVAWMIALGVICGAGAASARERTTTTPQTEQTRPAPEVCVTEATSPVNRPMLTAGLLFFGATYAASAATAYVSSRPEDQRYLYIPVAGPWLDIAHRRETTSRAATNEGFNTTLLFFGGAAQGLGALMVLGSLFVPETKEPSWHIVGTDKLHVHPMAVGSGYGIGAAGRF
jgi:hypothetical protein